MKEESAMSAKKLIKHARAIVTCDEKDQVFWDCDMLIDGPQIIKIGKDINDEEAEIINAKDKFCLLYTSDAADD